MAQPLKSFEGVRMVLAAAVLAICACRGNAVSDTQNASPAVAQTAATATVAPASVSSPPVLTDATTLQVGHKPSPGSTPTSTGEAGPPSQNTTAATETAPVAVTGTHLAPPP